MSSAGNRGIISNNAGYAWKVPKEADKPAASAGSTAERRRVSRPSTVHLPGAWSDDTLCLHAPVVSVLTKAAFAVHVYALPPPSTNIPTACSSSQSIYSRAFVPPPLSSFSFLYL